MFVVTGASGNIGREVAAQLVGRGVPTRVVERNPGGTSGPPDVESIAGDLSDPTSLDTAFRGADAVFLLPGFPGAATAAHDAGVPRVVQLSGGSAGSAEAGNAITRYMRETEAELRDTGVEWTAIRPAAFMSNALQWAEQVRAGDTVRLPFADVALATVHPADIAAVAVTAMLEDGHASMIYRPTGPAALLPGDQVAIVAAATGRELTFEPQSNADARREMLATTPPAYVAAFFDFYVNGTIDETTVRTTVADVTGREPRPFADWVADNLDAFRS